MEQPKKQSAFQTYKVMVTLAIIFFCGNAFDISLPLLNAQAPGGGSSPPADPAAAQQYVVCQLEMGKFLEVELGKFRDFIRTNFQNKSSTGSLLAPAFARYEELRTTVYDKFHTYVPQQGASQLDESLANSGCARQVENTLALAKREIESRAEQTSTVKHTTALIQKYQQINTQLRTLTSTFSSMKAYLQTFADKLPCYIKKSCNKS